MKPVSFASLAHLVERTYPVLHRPHVLFTTYDGEPCFDLTQALSGGKTYAAFHVLGGDAQSRALAEMLAHAWVDIDHLLAVVDGDEAYDPKRAAGIGSRISAVTPPVALRSRYASRVGKSGHVILSGSERRPKALVHVEGAGTGPEKFAAWVVAVMAGLPYLYASVVRTQGARAAKAAAGSRS